jgi:hypothetical protein
MIKGKERRSNISDFNFGSPIKSKEEEILPKKYVLENKDSGFQESDGYLCKGCLLNYENERMANNYGIIDEEIDEGGFDLNPTMEEETKCHFCMKKRKDVEAVCLVEGLPSCINCSSNKKLESNNDLNYSSLGQILNETVILNGSLDKKKGLKRYKSESEFLSADRRNSQLENIQTKTLSEFQNYHSEEKEININHSRKKKSMFTGMHHPTLSLNLNSVYESTNATHDGTDMSFLAKSKISFHEYTHKEIDNKIMNLVSPKSSMDLKFKANNMKYFQIEKMCKSLDYIFDNSNKVTINLPIIYQSPKNTSGDSDLSKKLDSNGNYLLILLDEKNEFLFGIVLNFFNGKKIGKIFKKFHIVDEMHINKNNKSSNIEYFDPILENITIKNNLLSLDNFFNFDLLTYKFSIDNAKLLKFLTISRNRGLLTSGINFMNIYDMC